MPHSHLPLFFPAETQDNYDTSRIEALGDVEEYNVGDFIYRMGDISTDAYFVLSGAVESVCTYQNGKEILINVHGPNDYFGFAAAIENQPRTVCALVLEPTKVVKIGRDVFLSDFLSDPDLREFLMSKMAYKIRHLTIRLSNSACVSPKELVIRDILQRYIDEGRPDKVIVPPRRLWASYLGTTRETLSRMLSDLQSEGSLEFLDKTSLRIHDFEALSDYSEQDTKFYEDV